MTNNAARGFQESLTENLAQVFLGQGHFEQPVTFLEPGAAAARTANVVFDASEQLDAGGNYVALAQTFECVIGRDPAAACGGIVAPVKGLVIVLADGTAYQWSERIIDQDEQSYTLEFKRTTPRTIGQKSQ